MIVVTPSDQGGYIHNVVISKPSTGSISVLESVGLKGDKGDPGEAYRQYISSGSISGHRVVSLNASGQVEYTNPTDKPSISRIVGVTLNAASLGGTLNVVKNSEVTEPSWNWNTNSAVYLAANGSLTQTVPTKQDVTFLVVVGFPISPTTLFVNIGIPIELN